MFQFVGLSAFAGPNALDYAPSGVDKIKSTELKNAIFDHFNATYDISQFGDSTIPTAWTYDTILNATFNGTTGAGNLAYAIKYVDSIKIKRRRKGEASEWITLEEVKINSIEDLTFTFNDFLNAWGIEYEYALVPVVGGVEGRYIIGNILSKFNGVFIGDAKQAFKFLYDVSYSGNARKQRTGTFEPLGRKYPIIVANGVLSYEAGSVTGTILDDQFEKTGIVDRVKTVKKKNALKDFLTNKRPKILKDWSGNSWLILVTDDVPVEYKEGSGMGIPQVTFNWNEIGDIENQEDLYDAGLIDALD